MRVRATKRARRAELFGLSGMFHRESWQKEVNVGYTSRLITHTKRFFHVKKRERTAMAIDALRADEKRGAPTRSRLGTLPDRGARVRDSDWMARRAGLEACGAIGRALFAAAPAGGAYAGWAAACPASMWTQWRGAKKSTRRVEVMLTQVRARDPDSPGAARAGPLGTRTRRAFPRSRREGFAIHLPARDRGGRRHET